MFLHLTISKSTKYWSLIIYISYNDFELSNILKIVFLCYEALIHGMVQQESWLDIMLGILLIHDWISILIKEQKNELPLVQNEKLMTKIRL